MPTPLEGEQVWDSPDSLQANPQLHGPQLSGFSREKLQKPGPGAPRGGTDPTPSPGGGKWGVGGCKGKSQGLGTTAGLNHHSSAPPSWVASQGSCSRPSELVCTGGRTGPLARVGAMPGAWHGAGTVLGLGHNSGKRQARAFFSPS